MDAKLNDNGMIELDLYEVVKEVVDKMHADETDCIQTELIITAFGITDQIREWMVDRLANAYSRKNYNSSVHMDRQNFLNSITENEIAYYADKITSEINEERRHNQAYWKLYHWCSDRGLTHEQDFPRLEGLKPEYYAWQEETEKRIKAILSKCLKGEE